MNGPAILSLGSVNADFQARTCGARADAELQLAHDFVRLSGGKAANVAFIARRLGAPACLIARVGDDDLAAQALGGLAALGVDLSGVSAARDASTGVAMITVPDSGDKRIVLAPNANDCWSEADAERARAIVEAAADGSVLVADCEVPAFVVDAAVGAAVRRGLAVVIDPSPPDRLGRDTLAMATALTPNAEEAGALSGMTVEDAPTAGEAARRLAARGPAIACVKLADGGAVVAHDDRLSLVPPAKVEVVDKTGAGDAFTGAFASALLEGQPPLEAALLATAAASLAVTAFGSQPSYAPRSRIEQLASDLRPDVRALDAA
jgi:ribokinase